MPAEIAIDLMVGGRIPQRKVTEVDSGLLNAFPQRGHMVSQALSRVDDNVLIREAQRGNRVAFEELVRQYDQAVLRLALRLTASESDAQDIYQEAFLKAYRNLGDTLASQSRWPDAISALRKAVELDSGNADVRYDLASVLLESGNLDDAITEFRATLRIAPTMVDAHNNLGIALGSQGKLDEAIEEFRRVLAIRPDVASAQQNLAMALAAVRARGK